MQKLPLSTYSFEKIREQNLLYVDKTKQVYEVMNYSDFVFLSRPRRFGKSLLLSTLSTLFAGKKELFNGLWIENKIDWAIFPVIHLNFAQLTHDKTEPIFDESGIRILRQVAWSYEIEIKATTFGDYLDELIYQLYKKTKKRVVLLIDEYDKPISDHLNQPEKAERNRLWLRAIFEKIKAKEDLLHFFMMTGISKFAKMSVFSVLNNIQDISLTPQFNNIIGFDEAEIRHYFAKRLPVFAKKHDISTDVLLAKIRYWYNGYSWDGNNKVYNPYSVVHVFQDMNFENYWFETGTPNFLMQLAREKYAVEQEDEPTIPQFENIEVSKSIYEVYNLKNLNLISLLLQTGYLTIVERIGSGYSEIFKLNFPNQEVRLSFSDHLLEAFTQKSISVQLPPKKIGISKALRDKNISQFIIQIKAFFASIPYLLRKEANEAYYQTVFYALLTSLGFRLILEKMTDKGRIDAVLELDHVIYVIEFKYSQSGTIEYWLKEGMEQIYKIGYYEQFEGAGKDIFLIAVTFLDKLDKNNKRVLTIDYLLEKG